MGWLQPGILHSPEAGPPFAYSQPLGSSLTLFSSCSRNFTPRSLCHPWRILLTLFSLFQRLLSFYLPRSSTSAPTYILLPTDLFHNYILVSITSTVRNFLPAFGSVEEFSWATNRVSVPNRPIYMEIILLWDYTSMSWKYSTLPPTNHWSDVGLYTFSFWEHHVNGSF